MSQRKAAARRISIWESNGDYRKKRKANSASHLVERVDGFSDALFDRKPVLLRLIGWVPVPIVKCIKRIL
jgi:hypothetical protein